MTMLMKWMNKVIAVDEERLLWLVEMTMVGGCKRNGGKWAVGTYL